MVVDDAESCLRIDDAEYFIKPLHLVPKLMNECCDLINLEWKRSLTARLRSIENSSDNLPASVILIYKSESMKVVGHCRATRIFTLNLPSAFIESVVIHPSLRGKGLGTYLMLGTEKYLSNLGIRYAYLSTKDQEKFYEKLGYEECLPVSIYGGALSLPERKSSSVIRTAATSAVTETMLAAPPPPPLPNVNTIMSFVSKTFMKKELT